jgi:hypothetical protein
LQKLGTLARESATRLEWQIAKRALLVEAERNRRHDDERCPTAMVMRDWLV